MFNAAGIQLNILIGPTVPMPAPYPLLEAFESLTVTATDDGPSGFQLALRASRESPGGIFDYELLESPVMRPFSRVIFIVLFNLTPHVIFDGFITHLELQPDGAMLFITGEDVSVKMDLIERTRQYVDLPDDAIVETTLSEYMEYVQMNEVIPLPEGMPSLETSGFRSQQGTDRLFIRYLAEKYGYVFFVEPLDVPGTNRSYWGPPPRLSAPQPALAVNMGSATNVAGISFTYDALKPFTLNGVVQGANTGLAEPVEALVSERIPLSLEPALIRNQPNVPIRKFRASGLTETQAMVRAEGAVSRSTDGVVEAHGTLDAVRYDSVLRPRRLVGMRGAGFSYDGFYYVSSVTHNISKGNYSQDFVLTRDGTGSTTPVVLQ